MTSPTIPSDPSPAPDDASPAPEPATASGPRGLIARLVEIDPYIGPQLVIGAAILLQLSLPEKVTLGPFWLLPTLEAILLVGLAATAPHRTFGRSPARRNIAMGLIAIVSAVNIVSLVLLCHYLIHGRNENGRDLILGGVVLWVTNVLLFGIWYWELDRGGPLARGSDPEPPDFLFPQMTEPKLCPGWSPNLIDYLYVSFTNATAFSPTDAMPLSRQAKVLMAAQALAALVTVGLVVARAVNILPAG